LKYTWKKLNDYKKCYTYCLWNMQKSTISHDKLINTDNFTKKYRPRFPRKKIAWDFFSLLITTHFCRSYSNYFHFYFLYQCPCVVKKTLLNRSFLSWWVFSSPFSAKLMKLQLFLRKTWLTIKNWQLFAPHAMY